MREFMGGIEITAEDVRRAEDEFVSFMKSIRMMARVYSRLHKVPEHIVLQMVRDVMQAEIDKAKN